MSKNDDKIKSLLTEINNKKAEMGTKPRAQWRTNGLLRTIGKDGVNINTINSTEVCVELASRLLMDKAYYSEACRFLGVKELDFFDSVSYVNDALEDIKLRNQMILWDVEKKKLDAMEKRLKDLRSADAKTEEALQDIEKALT